MTLSRSVLGVALFLLVILAYRWGINAVVQKAIRESQNTKNAWSGGSNPFDGKPITGFGPKIEPLDMQRFQEGFLYKPSENGPWSDRRDR
jgi:hypothetical protein